MNRRLLLIPLGVSLLIAGILYGQAPSGERAKEKPHRSEGERKTLDLIRSIYRDMTLTEREGVCAMDVTVTTVDSSFGTLDTSTASVHYLASKDRVHYSSEQLSFFYDRDVALAVMPDRKTLFLSPSRMEAIRNKQKGAFAILQDSLFENCSIISNEIIAEGESDRRLLLAAGEGMRAQYRIDRITLRMNMEKRTIQEIAVECVPENDLRSVTMEYEKLEWLGSTPEFDRPILDLVFEKNGQLLPEYQGYSVIDKRGER